MKLLDISLNNLRRKKGRTFFLVSGLAIGIGAAVAMTSVGDAMNREVMHALDEFGANILVLPASEGLPLSYGGLTVSAVNTGGRELTTHDVDRIRTIKNKENISTDRAEAAGPDRGEGDQGAGRRRGLQGGAAAQKMVARRLGHEPRRQAARRLIGKDAAAKLHLAPGDSIAVGRGDLRVSGVLDNTGLPGRRPDLRRYRLGPEAVQQRERGQPDRAVGPLQRLPHRGHGGPGEQRRCRARGPWRSRRPWSSRCRPCITSTSSRSASRRCS